MENFLGILVIALVQSRTLTLDKNPYVYGLKCILIFVIVDFPDKYGLTPLIFNFKRESFDYYQRKQNFVL